MRAAVSLNIPDEMAMDEVTIKYHKAALDAGCLWVNILYTVNLHYIK